MFSASVFVILLGLSVQGFAQLEDSAKMIAKLGTKFTFPANLTLDEGEIIFSLVWKHNDNDIVTYSPGLNILKYQEEYEGRTEINAEDYSLALEELDFSDSGVYELATVGTSGSGIIRYNFEVLASPKVSAQAFSVTDDQSGTEQVLAECKAEAGSSPFTIEWHDGDTIVADTTDSKDAENAENEMLFDSVLELKSVPSASSDNGKIMTCVVKDAFESIIERQVTLKVTEPTTTVPTTTMQAYPVITKFPQSETMTLVLGKSRVLTCKATGVPEPTVTWYKDGVEINSGLGECRLDVFANDYSVTGKYRCEAKNVEDTEKREMSIEVQGSPEIVGLDLLPNQTEKYVITAGDDFVRLYCQSDAYPTPVIEWKVEGANLTDLDALHKVLESEGSASSNLNISSKHFSGPNPISKVFCTAKNQHGDAMKTFVVAAPVAASNIGMIVGVVVGLIILIMISVVIAYFLVTNKRSRSKITSPESGAACGLSSCCGGSKVKSKELKEEDDVVTVEHVKEVSEEGTNEEKQKLTEAEEKPANEEDEKKVEVTPEGTENKDDEESEKPKKSKKKIPLPMQCCKGTKKAKNDTEDETEKETGEGTEEKETGNGDTKTTEQAEIDRDSGKGDTLGKALDDESQQK